MKLLFVEDDKKIATAVKRGLEAEGFTVEVAYDGEDGLWMATEGSYDLIVLDIMLPGRNGYLVCADLREAGDWTPILMLTAKDGELDEAEALDTGADDYLDQAVLVRRTRRPHPGAAATRRRADPGAGVGGRRCGSIRRAGECGAATREVTLTAREFDVLEFLVRRAGQVLSKDEILDGVWELGLRRRPEHRRGLHRPAAAQARRAASGTVADRDGARRRIPPGRRGCLSGVGRGPGRSAGG